MIIYASNGTPIINIKVDDSSYKYEEIMGDCNVYLEFALTEHIEIEPGAYIMFQGVKYELMTRENVAIQHTRNYEYKATFSGAQARFERYVMYNTIDGRLHFDMIGKPLDHLTMVINNLNLRERGTWSIGSYVDKEERLVSYNHTSVRDALSMIAEAFDTEWSVEPNGGGFIINLRKNEFNKNSPLSLGYGKNQGFKPGVGRYNYGDFGQVERVWIDGGERNLSLENYPYTTLHFPRSLTFQCDTNLRLKYTILGVAYTQPGFNSASALTFVTDEYGASVKIAGAADSCIEASLDLTQFYPKREGQITGVYYTYKKDYLTYEQLVTTYQNIDWNEVQVDIVDNDIPAELDYSNYLFGNDEPLTVIFQNGQLAGRQFNATFCKEAKTRNVTDPNTGEPVIDPSTGGPQTEIIRPADRFELVKTTIDGIDMPCFGFLPEFGQRYIVVNCGLPGLYTCSYQNFSGAELDALRAACQFIFDNKDPQFTFKGTVDDLYSKRNWTNISGNLILGGCISFQDSNIQPTPIITRIIGLKTFVNNPFAPEITLSNETVKGGMSSKIAKLNARDEHVIERVKDARNFSKRSFRDAKETIDMLAGSIDYFSEGINPITVETMSLLVGYEALQYKFWEDRTCVTPIINPVVYNANNATLICSQCAIQHMTLGLTDVKPSTARRVNEYIRWSLPGKTFGPLNADDGQGGSLSDKAYYLYAKVDAANVPDTTNTPEEEGGVPYEDLSHVGGEFYLTDTKIVLKKNLEPDEGYYYLLVGILNSEFDGTRSFAPMYGFTEILPGQITTDVIRSSSGESYFDLVNNQFALGQSLSFIDNTLKLSGALVQTGDNRYVNLGAWCGQWTIGTKYKNGDEVWWQAPNGTVSSYRYIYPTSSIASAENNPSNRAYWQVFASGIKGDDGNPGAYKSTVFMRTNDDLGAEIHRPSGGSYSSPRPTSSHTDSASQTVLYWTDGIPAGLAKLWASTCIFYSDGTSTGWDIPVQMTDTATYDVEFALATAGDTKPADPTYGTGGTAESRGAGNNRNDGWYDSYSEASTHGVIWYDPDTDASLSGLDWDKMVWRAERWMKNGEWTDWTIFEILGEDGQSSYKSTMFVRTSDGTPTKPANTDGSFINPSPYVLAGQNAAGTNVYWEDGIPAGDEQLWATTRIFTSDGLSPQQASWSDPRAMTDTDWYDVEFAPYQSGGSTPANPTYGTGGTIDSRGPGNNRNDGLYSTYSAAISHGMIWFDPNTDANLSGIDWTEMYWRAERECKNGVWGDWIVVLIKGEKGDTGGVGNGIYSIDCYYAFSISSSTPPGESATWYDEEHRPSLSGHSGQYIWTKTVIQYTDPNMQDKITYEASYIARDGSDGSDGSPGFMVINRGEYDDDETYYGNEERRDAVWYNGYWYLSLEVQGGEFDGIKPDDASGSSYWAPFEGSFSNIATGLISSIQGWFQYLGVGNLETYTTSSSAKIVAKENYLELYDRYGDPRFLLYGNDIEIGTPTNVYSVTSFLAHRTYSSGGSYSLNGTLCSNIYASSGEIISIPSFTITTELDTADDLAEATVTITLYRGATAILQKTANCYNSGVSTWTAHTASDTYTSTSSNTYSLEIDVSLVITKYSVAPRIMWDIIAEADGGVTVYGDNVQQVQIGANGFVAHLSNGFSAIIATDPSQSYAPKIQLQGMMSGQLVGLKIDSVDGVQINRGDGQGWVDL